MIISFSGNDGSGKTTIINSFQKSIKKDNPNLIVEVRHEFDYFLLKYLLKLLNSKRDDLKKDYLKPAKKNSSKLIGFLWSILVCIDLYLEYLYLKLNSKLFKKIIILDRCIYDFYISWLYLEVSTNFTKNLVKFFPSYDVGYVLFVEPKLAYHRKIKTHTYPLEFYKKQSQRYFDLKLFKKDLIFIDTDSSLDKTLKDVQKAFLKKYFSKTNCNKDNFSLFIKFINLCVNKNLDCIKNLKRHKSPEALKNIINIKDFAVIKSFYLDSKNIKNEIDVYTNVLKKDLIKKFNTKNINYIEEPDRLGFDLEKTEIDLHLGLSFWNHKFIKDDYLRPINNYFDISIEYLIYSIHSSYKHGKLSMDDICASIYILQNENKIQKEKFNIYKFIKGWEDGFYYFNNQLRVNVLKDEIKSSWVPVNKYLYFWLKIYFKNNSIGLKSLIIISYAYLRDRYMFFRKISSYLFNSLIGNLIKKRLGYVYK